MTSFNIYTLLDSSTHLPLSWVLDLYIQLLTEPPSWVSLRQLQLSMLIIEHMIFPFRPASSYFYTCSYPKGREMMHLPTSIINSVTQTKIWGLALLFPFHLSSPHPVTRYYWCCSLCSFCISLLLSFSTPLCSFNYHLKYCCNFLRGSPFFTRLFITSSDAFISKDNGWKDIGTYLYNSKMQPFV